MEWIFTHKKATSSNLTSQQRGTYLLQLPYGYSIPLLIGSGLLHWLVSQSIFLTRVRVLDAAGSFRIVSIDDPLSDGRATRVLKEICTCGYSPIAIVFVIALGSIVMLLGIIDGLRQLKVGIPVAGSCSAAISAACHPPQGDSSPSLKPVMWVVVAKEEVEISDNDIGHCTFTGLEVEPPKCGQRCVGSHSTRFRSWQSLVLVKGHLVGAKSDSLNPFLGNPRTISWSPET